VLGIRKDFVDSELITLSPGHVAKFKFDKTAWRVKFQVQEDYFKLVEEDPQAAVFVFVTLSPSLLGHQFPVSLGPPPVLF